jgi:hypothetical protein
MARIASTSESVELYIPMGHSPGLSDSLTIVGQVETIDHQTGVMTVSGGDTTRQVQMPESTAVYLDYNRHGKANVYGSVEEIQPRDLVEVYVVNDGEGGGGDVVWVKVQR